jgi:ATP-binding cassette subfamily C exporter for protease/lipase
MNPAQEKGEIAQALAGVRSVFRTVGIFSLFINLLMLTPSLYMLQVYDRVLPSHNEYTLWMLSMMILGVYAFIAALEYVRSQVVIRVGARLDASLNQRIYTAAFEQNLKKPGTHAGQALNDLTTLRQFVTGNALFTFFDAPWFPIYLLVIFMFDPLLGLFALSGTLLLIALAVLNEKVSHKPLAEASALAISSSTLATNNLRNAQVIEAMGMLPDLRQRWYKVHLKFLDQHAEASRKAAVIATLTKFVRLAQQSLVLGFGAWLVLDGRISGGMMIAATILVGKALSPVEAVIGVWRQWSGVKSAHQRLDALLLANPARKSGMRLPPPNGFVAVEAVSAAPPGHPVAVLKSVSFSLQPGDVLCVLGPSAAGKSTLARLLVGIWPAASGKVRLDNSDVYQWNKDELGPWVGYLPQDVELFGGTIGENIARFGAVDSEKVIQAAQRAGMHDLILHFPQGYDTVLGEGGAGLSGGQRQRIGLARALYGDPSLLVLDEPNANLDEAGEQALMKAIKDLQQRGKTVVLIAHRAGVVSIANKLLILRDGAVQAFGPRDEVLQAMAKAQASSAAPASAAPRAAAAPVPLLPHMKLPSFTTKSAPT